MKPAIRLDAEQTGYDKGYRQAIEDNVAALNEWREAGKEIGRKLGVVSERERIIKLLEEHVHDSDCIEADSSRAYQAGFEHAIALIKGENK